ncbi:MAG TPA: tRNA (N(6)-L-threonylcarbamoyladenosine(37)-C(2))-methylthiotransferase MtaB [Candidatus Merdivicinus excrementipullorum]|uniref:Threonylcarbamoyladenosine tRNA methylthiotransferase MtaB n=1 Tax=Candidatus Merdivicinus excrementipullorum TaxID=2840867 RepID=A0A9D1FLC8_9FIRM|nr:tRNA (N(6)-L-threonylcarbamoyladenosine(37)-C(2))-methylthiotransferase MtaB [Candidatus Merdivicinus excrementipullorum]
MRAAFTTLGCKVNQYETEMLAELFAKEGYEVVEPHDFADLYVVNSCTVTASGDRKTRQLLRRLKKQNPAAKAALTGCYPQAFPEEAAAIPEADIVTGSKNRAGLLAAVSRAFQTGQRVVAIEPHEKGESFEHMSVTGLRGRTRAFVKIQDGCERYCSYCIIPKARGPVRSKPLAEIRAELQNLAANGYREAVLVGINLSSYGKDLGLRLIDAVEEACRVEGIERVRLGSLEPELLTGEDIARMAAQKKFCPQFHLALQSGCDKTLKAMNRHYDTAEFARIAADIRRSFENPSLTTDVMVGFAGETEEDFLESLAFVKQMAFAKVHVFAYSRREGTAAAKRPEQAPESVKEDRSRRMIEATEEVRRAFLMSQLGRTEEVLVETTHSPLGYEGFTKNYTPVYVNCGPEACGKVCKVRLEAVLEGHCTGTLEP